MADKRLDDYQPLKFYTDRRPDDAKAIGFYKLADDGLEYFAYAAEGKTLLISQAYKARAGRDNGIVSTQKNMKLEEQYEFEKHSNGKHYFNILARNKQQVATSVWFASAKAAREHAEVLMGKRKGLPGGTRAATATAGAKAARTANKEQNYLPREMYERLGGTTRDGFTRFENDGQHYFTFNQGGKVVLISEGYPDAKTRDRGIASVEKNMTTEDRYRYEGETFSLRAGNNKEIARGLGYASAAAAATGAAALYAPKLAKKARAANVEQNYKPLAFYEARIQGVDDGFDTFTEDGQHYFTYNRDGKINLISEGYPSAAIRDKGIASVKANMGEEKQFTYGDVGGGYDGYRLRAKNNKEIARSVAYPTAAAAAAAAALLLAPKVAKAAPAPVPAPEPEPKIAVAPVAAVAAAAVAAPVAVAAMAREPEPAAASYAPAMVHEEAAGFGWLKWLALAAILAALLFGLLTFCNRDVDAPLAVAPVPEPTLVTCWNGTEAESRAACPAELTCWNGDKVTDFDNCPVEPPRMVTCADGSEAERFADCPPVVEAEPEPEPEPVRTATPTRATAVNSGLSYTATAGSCSCATGNAKLFETRGSKRAVRVSKLGTNPEFGNADGISARAFYDRLNARYASNSYDANYLDYLARSIGYAGWRSMDASMFSEETVAPGSRVMLGFGEQHALQYSQLDMPASELGAFRVRSANGCDVNFMRKCGNFAFVCQ